MLPFEPEPEEQLEARFHLALTPEYDVLEILKHPQRTPTKLRKHVFDFKDGIRMGVSVDIANGERLLHLSFSVQPPRTERDMDFGLCILALVEKFAKPDQNTAAQNCCTPAGVEHFFFPLAPSA